MRNQLPNVKLQLHPFMFDLMMSVLAENAATAPDDYTRKAAENLMEKRMRYTRLFHEDGDDFASVRMYDSEASQMVWQLLVGAARYYDTKKEYSKELTGGETHGVPDSCE